MNILIIYLVGCVILYLTVSLLYKYNKSFTEDVDKASGAIKPTVVLAVFSITTWFGIAILLYGFIEHFILNIKLKWVVWKMKRLTNKALKELKTRYNIDIKDLKIN